MPRGILFLQQALPLQGNQQHPGGSLSSNCCRVHLFWRFTRSLAPIQASRRACAERCPKVPVPWGSARAVPGRRPPSAQRDREGGRDLCTKLKHPRPAPHPHPHITLEASDWLMWDISPETLLLSPDHLLASGHYLPCFPLPGRQAPCFHPRSAIGANWLHPNRGVSPCDTMR